MNKRSLEFWVGSFIFAGMAVLAAMIIRFGSYDKLRDTYEISADFNYTDGVIRGAPVRVSGVEVGRVTELRLTPDKETKVGIVMEVERNVKLRKNARVIINSLGIMGEKYVEFQPQSPDAPFLEPGESIRGEDPVSIASITAQMSHVVRQVQMVIGDEKTGNKLAEIMDNFVELTGKKNRENVQASLANFNAASTSMKDVFGKIQSGEGTAGQLIYKNELYDMMKAFMKGITENPSKLFRPTKDKKKGTGSTIFHKE